MGERRVVVTGLGAVTPLGLDVDRMWTAMLAGRSGIGALTRFDVAHFPVKIAGTVEDEELAKKEAALGLAPGESRAARFALAAARMAAADAGLTPAEIDERTALYLGAGLGREHFDEAAALLVRASAALGTFDEALAAHVEELAALFAGAQAASLLPPIIEELGLSGPTIVVNAACASGAQAIGEAFRLIKTGEADRALCGGVDAMVTPEGLLFFHALGVLSQNPDPRRASRPFDRERDGFVAAEGAAMVVLEAREPARRRGARIHAEIVGYGARSEAHHISTPDPTGRVPAATIGDALREAGAAPAEVQHVNAHGTSTLYNDKVETLALKTVFGDHARAIAVTANKSMLGHMVSAAGAVELVATVLTVRDGVIPPTINYEHPDPDCDLDFVPNQARTRGVELAVSNSFGFGGQDVCLAVRRHES